MPLLSISQRKNSAFLLPKEARPVLPLSHGKDTGTLWNSPDDASDSSPEPLPGFWLGFWLKASPKCNGGIKI